MVQYADNDPAAFEAMKKAIEVAHGAANRWTDNIFTVRQWCSNNFPEAKEQLEHMYKELLPPAIPLRAVGDGEGNP
ncbi:arabinogalactan peptide 22 [Hibiscus syriacus]|uniref:Arabinogalactan peptide 22 n=1 Tax=Hibiscus syriacus TaxID=106335 RepID=A0A6A2YH46_HIBSY|nr:arabinogalactan peptide 22 [Hibiscus syriacus]